MSNFSHKTMNGNWFEDRLQPKQPYQENPEMRIVSTFRD